MGHINFKDHAIITRWWVGKNECDEQQAQRRKKNGVIIKSSLHLLLKVVCIFEVLEFIAT
jgi:hypothetical protein